MPLMRTQIIPNSFREKHAYTTIPEPYANVESLQATVKALVEVVETLVNRRGNADHAAVTYRDLVLMGLMAPQDVPKDGGPPRTV